MPYLVAKICHYANKLVRADVRQCVVHNILGRAATHKLTEHGAGKGRRNTRRQFTVGKRACTSQTELNVCFGVKFAAEEKFFNGLFAFGNVRAFFHNGHPEAAFCKIQRGKQPCRTTADNYRMFVVKCLVRHDVLQNVSWQNIRRCIANESFFDVN